MDLIKLQKTINRLEKEGIKTDRISPKTLLKGGEITHKREYFKHGTRSQRKLANRKRRAELTWQKGQFRNIRVDDNGDIDGNQCSVRNTSYGDIHYIRDTTSDYQSIKNLMSN